MAGETGINFNLFGGNTGGTDVNSKTQALFVVRHSTWPGLTHCRINTFTLKIERLAVQGGSLVRTPIRTFSFPNMELPPAQCPVAVCATWDGSFAVDDKGFGKMNGTYEATAEIVFVDTTTGNKSELKDIKYPGENQHPLLIDVMDIHSVISSPTVFGSAVIFPIGINYRLSKSAYVAIDIFKGSELDCAQVLCTRDNVNAACTGVGNISNNTTNPHPVQRVGAGCSTSFVRRIVKNQPRQGEDTTSSQGKVLSITDNWDGRTEDNLLVSSGVYTFLMYAWDPDSNTGSEGADHAHDISRPTTFSNFIDPMQIIDVRAEGLSTQSTSFAGVSFQLTEAATVYFDVWLASSSFQNPDGFGAPSVACDGSSVHLATNSATNPNHGCRVRGYQNAFPGRQTVSFVWDGRDRNGNPLDDSQYQFSLYAQLQQGSFGGIAPAIAPAILVSKVKTGLIPVTRGLVPISQVTTFSSSFSSPPVTNVEPFFFNYSLGRDAHVNVRVKAMLNQTVGSFISFDSNGNIVPPATANSTKVCPSTSGCTIAHLVRDEVRPGAISITDPPIGWDGRTIGLNQQNGVRVSSGVYMAELIAQDTLFPNRINTLNSFFTANMLRTSQVRSTPLLSGATDIATISYVLSEPMDTRWEIYSPTSVFSGSWPALTLTQGTLIRTIFGSRPGRLSITEFWDGKNEEGFFVPDGNYVSILKSSDVYGNYATDAVIREIGVIRGQIQILNPEVTPTFPEVNEASDTLNIPLEPFEITFTLSRDAIVTVDIKNLDQNLVKRLVDEEPRSGLIEQAEFWDGTNFAEIRQTTGSFFVEILAEDLTAINASSSIARLPLSVDLLRIYDVAVTPLTSEVESAEVTYQLSEPMNVELKIFKPGTIFNVAGQPIPPESESLVFLIQGPRPSRVPLTELWTGINLFQKQVVDGNYVFRLRATDERDNLATNIEHGQVPVLRLGFLDPQATFDDQTFAYPNPITKTPLKICSLLPIDADVNLKIYTLSGELVWEKGLGRILGGKGPCNGLPAVEWNLENGFGRRVTRGVYFYVLRADSFGGDRQFLQTMKKVLVP
ncbi:MAG: hypothetical protein HYT79_12345 [Elusimicrobia bacterium]|nr:hypothetical protein [Elusimicrobiota bacterium]